MGKLSSAKPPDSKPPIKGKLSPFYDLYKQADTQTQTPGFHQTTKPPNHQSQPFWGKPWFFKSRLLGWRDDHAPRRGVGGGAPRHPEAAGSQDCLTTQPRREEQGEAPVFFFFFAFLELSFLWV